MNTTATFFQAITMGDVGQVDALLQSEPGLSRALAVNGVSAVLWAAYHGQGEVLERLIAADVELDVFEAAAVGDLGRARALLSESPALANAHSGDGFSPLGLAAFFGNMEVVTLLLSCGANPNAASRNPMRVTPLHSAVAHRQRDVSSRMAEALLRFGADPNLQQQGGWTPLHQAAAHGREDLVELLLEHGADPSASSVEGLTPEQKAIEGGHLQVAERLRRGAPEAADEGADR